jgi:hypothetical protein
VYMTLGNHESMVLLGDTRYLAKKYRAVGRALGVPSYSHLWDDNSVLGKWLRSKGVVLRVGDLLCLHGGISPEVVERSLSLKDINIAGRAALRDTPLPEGGAVAKLSALPLLQKNPAATDAERKTAAFVVANSTGPLWYRGYFPEEAKEAGNTVATDAEVSAMLAHFKVRTILIGHTIVPSVTALYGGKVIAVQVYPRIDEASHAPVMEALRIENGKFFKARIDGTLEELR